MTAPTVERVLEVMAEVVAEYGEDHVYKSPDEASEYSCVYVHSGCPSCLIAHVLARLGVPLERLAAMEGEFAGVVVAEVWGVDRFGSLATVLIAAQALSDSGGTWGEALAEARAKAGEMAA